MRKTILLINNTTTTKNPALHFFIQCLKHEYNLIVSGNEVLKSSTYKEIRYRNHESTYRFLTRFKFLRLLKLCCLLTFQDKVVFEILALRIRLILCSIELKYKIPKVDLIIGLDTEAAYISLALQKRHKIPLWYFVYDFYPDQYLNISSRLKQLLIRIEKESISSSTLILSSLNDEMGLHLNEKYKLSKAIHALFICPEPAFEIDKLPVLNDPIKIYYHGLISPNRGLEHLIEAMSGIDGIELYLRGNGTLVDKLQQMIEECNLSAKVFLLDSIPTEQLASAAADYDIGITMVRMNVLNHLYAAGFKTQENIAAGLALVIPNSYPLRRLNDTYELGVTYRDALKEDLVEVLRYITQNRSKVLEWKRNVRRAALDQLNPNAQKIQLIQTIKVHIGD